MLLRQEQHLGVARIQAGRLIVNVGGIVGRKPDLVVNSRFRAGFERKGRHRSLMEKISTQVILHPQPGLLGASYYALRLTNVN